ncbi:hypothetical protein H310_02991 [Aphanomyces invadans]|uniref:Serine protease n=1 Tax=Aphanomyces invadans TaxID=157072 RepID=A0A024UML6_9STRA|nr:hypothetical protein H310_02991 [Aphanomyces invadans]ETW06858.1 hypothetical protein H310_02991 [Aphanomyces invadans]RHY26426.1 hypothetical protein DYB32_007617 [Aphanomyces invadans]|eukprot:XP_008864933.1 hypothetical protein H310_02991 [Aphanomyces invadans]
MITALKTLTILALATSASAGGVVSVIGDAESICGTDQAQPAIAYKNSDAAKYKVGLATARLGLRGGYCTGWLWGSEGHLMTNNHCIRDASTASTAVAEFDAECATVDDPNNKKQLGCKGVFVSNSSTFIITDVTLDFTLVKLNVNPGMSLTQYGYLQARDSDVQLDDAIYIAGHPNTYPRHISHLNDDGKFARITNTSVKGCSADNLAYNVDTQGGNSGSPILGQRDNRVVALHNCGSCSQFGLGANTGNKITKIIAFLRAKNLLPKDAVAGGNCKASTD